VHRGLPTRSKLRAQAGVGGFMRASGFGSDVLRSTALQLLAIAHRVVR
jgi:hypothetical protein